MFEIKSRVAFQISNILSLGWSTRKSRDKNQNKSLKKEKNEGKRPQKFKIRFLHQNKKAIYILFCTNLKLVKAQSR